MRHFLIDTDTASDDAVAIIMALRWPNVTVEAITIVSGNMPTQQGAKNALYTIELCGAEVPVTIGATKPLLHDNVHAEWFHGNDGLSDRHYPAAAQTVGTAHAVDTIIETARAHPGLVIVTLGPLTNLALAVMKAPDIVANVSRCVVMGGAACTEGNVTPAAEYNIWVDPEAARIVFHSGLPVEMVGWEHCRFDKALDEEEMAMVRAMNTPLAHFALDSNETAIAAYFTQSGARGLSLPDPVAMAVALDPTLVTHSSLHSVDVETHSELTRGMTVVDRLNVTHDERNRQTWASLIRKEPNVRVVWAIDTARWKEMLYECLR